MDIKEYIASGIIDSYVLGSVSDQERREVQCLSSIYPEIKAELQQAEQAMEDYATSVAVTPPESLKNSILAKIRELEQESAEPKISVAIPSQEKEVEEMPETKIIPISGIYKWSAAASVLVIIGLSLLYLNSATKANGLEQDLTALEEKADKNQETLEDKLLAMQSDLYAMQEREAFINAPNTQKLLLQATGVEPGASATAYFDQNTGNVILASNGLPEPVSGKQFQLWAIADGVPLDLGVLEKESAYSKTISVKNANVQAFAITLEKEGGSPTPTMDQMYVYGGV